MGGQPKTPIVASIAGFLRKVQAWGLGLMKVFLGAFRSYFGTWGFLKLQASASTSPKLTFSAFPQEPWWHFMVEMRICFCKTSWSAVNSQSPLQPEWIVTVLSRGIRDDSVLGKFVTSAFECHPIYIKMLSRGLFNEYVNFQESDLPKTKWEQKDLYEVQLLTLCVANFLPRPSTRYCT